MAPALTRHDLAGMASKLSEDIRNLNVGTIEINEAQKQLIIDLPRRLQSLQGNTVPQFYSSNAGQAVPAYITTINFIRSQVLPSLGFTEITDVKLLPSNIAKRARLANSALDQAIPNLEILKSKVIEIESAHSAADSLPIYLDEIKLGREELTRATSNAALAEKEADKAANLANDKLKEISALRTSAEMLVAQCEDAYKITTTKGLAAAFDLRARNLSNSLIIWVILLAAALIVGSMIGASRLNVLSEALIKPNANTAGIAIQVFLSMLSVGAPLWFSWLATKQIGQRFKLAEDYAFKASVAKAYEGYKKEAARLDPNFEARLFASALDRLDEAPLRLMETSTHGSPWHELVNSKAVEKAFEVMPELKDQVYTLLRDGINNTKGAITETEKSISKAKKPSPENEAEKP